MYLLHGGVRRALALYGQLERIRRPQWRTLSSAPLRVVIRQCTSPCAACKGLARAERVFVQGYDVMATVTNQVPQQDLCFA